MRTVSARSQSPRALAMMYGRPRLGTPLGHGHVNFDGYVISMTPPGARRMPNGVEAAVEARRGDEVRIGGGGLRVGSTLIEPGPIWQPIPPWVSAVLIADPALSPDPAALAGLGDGLTPAGDDVLIGYTAGRRLCFGDRRTANAVFAAAAPRTTSLSRTLLAHAVAGEVPEVVHALLCEGDPEPLLRFGRSSGRALLMGLAMAAGGGTHRPRDHARRMSLSLRDAGVDLTLDVTIAGPVLARAIGA